VNVDLMTLAEKLSGAGLATLLIMILVGGWRQYWVFGWQFKQLQDERDEWKRMALRGTDFAERAVSLVAKSPQQP
jgi:hypothetical protein